MLVSEPEAMHFPWRILFDAISFEHRTPAELDGLCFKTLLVGAHPIPCPCTPLAIACGTSGSQFDPFALR